MIIGGILASAYIAVIELNKDGDADFSPRHSGDRRWDADRIETHEQFIESISDSLKKN